MKLETPRPRETRGQLLPLSRDSLGVTRKGGGPEYGGFRHADLVEASPTHPGAVHPHRTGSRSDLETRIRTDGPS